MLLNAQRGTPPAATDAKMQYGGTIIQRGDGGWVYVGGDSDEGFELLLVDVIEVVK